MIDIGAGILKINSTATTIITGHDIADCKIEWVDTPEISKEDIKAAMDELQVEYDALEYSRARAISYPPIGDQLDALWKGGDAEIAMKVIIDKVKSDNPKP